MKVKSMHCLYNIHTHERVEGLIGGYEIRSLINVYPFDFKKKKEELLNVSFSCGVHPWHSSDFEGQLSELDKIVKDKTLVAIGETGLDKLRGPEMDIQKRIFRHHIVLSEMHKKPLIIHCVKAWDDLISVFKLEKPSMPWILHGFRGNLQQMRQLASLGFYFSIGEKYNEAAVKAIPAERLFCETDMSTSLNIYDVYGQVACTRSILIEQLVALVENNVKLTFCKS